MDGVHTPEVIEPWDATIIEFALVSLSQYNTRHYVVPPARGVDVRFLNGYMYLSPVAVRAPAEIESRIGEFTERAGFYFEHWTELERAWLPKLRALIAELEQIEFAPLPDREDMRVLVEGRGEGSGFALIANYHRLLDLTLKLWQHHFEFLNLGYAAYLDFFGFCKDLWPSIPDQAIASMVAGIRVDLFRPDEELKALATLAVRLGVAEPLRAGSVEQVLAAMDADAAGRQWREALETAKHPWFNFSAGSGFYHSDKVWLDHLDIPLGFVRHYVEAVERGESLDRPLEAIRAERDRIVGEYREFVEAEEDRLTFDAKLDLARTVFPYVENHNFYVEHWGHSVIWRKMRELGSMLAAHGFWERPEVITEPFTVMPWGVTSDSVRAWLGGADRVDAGEDLIGFAASPGVAEGHRSSASWRPP